MSKRCLDDCRWYRDPRSEASGEPGIPHTFIASLASANLYRNGAVDPARLMGATGFAFRIWINEQLCPSALSVFDWRSIIPEAIAQSGRKCLHISRLWDEEEWVDTRRREAQEAIIEAIESDEPAVVWNVAEPEWGLIIGYDEASATYDVLSDRSGRGTLPFQALGQNGVDILSVAIPHSSSHRSPAEVRRKAIQTAVRHADQEEWMDRPKYQDGLPAYDLWATVFDRWARLSRAGDTDGINDAFPLYALIYAQTYFSARHYAHNYLCAVAGEDKQLLAAADSYAAVAHSLRSVWKHTPKRKDEDSQTLAGIAADIREAKRHEEEGVELIHGWLEAEV